MNSPVVFTSEQLTVLNTIYQKYLSGQLLVFNPNNTISGTNTATLNALSGVVTFSTAVTDYPSVSSFYINNSFVTTETRAIINISTTTDGASIVNNGVKFGDGNITLLLNNGASSTAQGVPIIDFIILNP
jgi:hypothetical protein